MGKPAAAFGPPPGQNVAAGLAGHPFHKAVFAAALPFFGLISLLRHS